MNDKEHNYADEKPDAESADTAGIKNQINTEAGAQPEEIADSENAADIEPTSDTAAGKNQENPDDDKPPTYEELESEVAVLKDQLPRNGRSGKCAAERSVKRQMPQNMR